MKRNCRTAVSMALIMSCISAAPTEAIGLAMRFVDVTLENVAPGTHVNLRVARNLPLVVINQDPDKSANVLVEAVPPNPKEMKEGYEPIPDPNWLKTVPSQFVLGPKASAASDVILDVPNDPKLIGHHYEVILWVHTNEQRRIVDGGGVLFQAGLRSRFRMSIGTLGPASLQREKALKKLETINTDFSVNPPTIFIKNVPVGRPIDLKLEKKASLKVVNEADDPVDLKVHPVASDPNVSPESGYEYAPDPKWLIVTPEKVHVPGNSIREIKMKLTIPDEPRYHGKHYMFLVQTTLADDTLPLFYDNRIYIDTPP